ncbi:glutathione S-transferase family protein [Novosphingobium sp. KCTC 2891]|uniref:glutathione S-transferase family protein n=1 Tax=Novosphingobium sp. KCTC 2891 TaxID=2989730 RepID=UPI002222F6D5|nr:glutathione S-transferase family protein [Novosphingobium sp. KCTC 2891]MCW1382475.1 glutathione S-transferase family protein [Novosphingobium sp. KCTC 2891]
MLELYGHPFSSYTWKAVIALRVNETPFAFRMVGPEHPENTARVAAASPLGKFPLLIDDETHVFEATSIIEHVWLHHRGPAPLLPDDPVEAARVRMIDRVFDNYVMAPLQAVVGEYLRAPKAPDQVRIDEALAQLDRAYRWLEDWLAGYRSDGAISLIECAAAPSLFYADWVRPIGEAFPRLAAFRAHLLALPAVAHCIDEARPWRAFFPPGAPDRD